MILQFVFKLGQNSKFHILIQYCKIKRLNPFEPKTFKGSNQAEPPPNQTKPFTKTWSLNGLNR